MDELKDIVKEAVKEREDKLIERIENVVCIAVGIILMYLEFMNP